MNEYTIEYDGQFDSVHITLSAPKDKYLYALATMTQRFLMEAAILAGSASIEVRSYPGKCVILTDGIEVQAFNLIDAVRELEEMCDGRI